MRRVALVIVAMLAAAIGGVGLISTAFAATLPPKATLVPVASDEDASGINASLKVAGAIAGTVQDAASAQPLGGVEVEVFSHGSVVAWGDTDSDGTYLITGVVPASYVVCFDAANASGGSAPAGYANQCYDGVPWPGTRLPSGTQAVPVVAGSTTTVNAALDMLGGIAGQVTSSTGTGIKDVYVVVLSGRRSVGSDQTDADGNYHVIDLPASSTGYSVCFDAYSARSTTGYEDECYNDVPWTDQSTIPPGTTQVPVTTGAITSGIDAALSASGAISGTATSAADSTAVSDVSVLAYSLADQSLATQNSYALTSSTGTYRLKQMHPSTSGYQVCFSAGDASGSSPTGYLSQCTINQPWNGQWPPPVPASPVVARAGKITPHVDASLARGGAITGKLTSQADGSPLADVSVGFIDASGNPLGNAYTGDAGVYRIEGLPNEAGYVCFDGSFARPRGGTNSPFENTCYGGGSWDGGAPTPEATEITVATSKTRTNLGAALMPSAPPADNGTISGRVIESSDHHGVFGAYIEVFEPTSGDQIDYTATDSSGHYTISVPPDASGYDVCFNANMVFSGAPPTGFTSQCYRAIAWNAVPPGSGGLAGTGVDVRSELGVGLLAIVAGLVVLVVAGRRARVRSEAVWSSLH